MRNHDKVRDMSRSVLPSVARSGARKNRRLIHHAERRAVAAALARGDDRTVIRSYRGDIRNMVGTRRGADKVGPLVRWALHQVRTNPDLRDASLGDQVDFFRQLLPNTTIGRHALSHIAWPLEFQHPDAPRRWYHAYPPPTPPPSVAPIVRALFEAGYHAELNKRLKRAYEPTLAGIAELEQFAATASPYARDVVVDLARAVQLRV